MSHEHLTNFPHDPLLDLDPWVGQRQASFKFKLINGVTGIHLGEIHPIRGATLTHDTSRTIKRQLTLSLGRADRAAINPLTDRVLPYMVFPNGAEYPLGKYMFTLSSKREFTSGDLGEVTLSDEMFLVDQQLSRGIDGIAKNVIVTIADILEGLPIQWRAEDSPFQSFQSWTVGTNRGQVLEALCLAGDLFSPWFSNDGFMNFIRSFDPLNKIPDFDFDAGNKVMRADIVNTSDILIAPNRFIVVSNSTDLNGDSATPIVGIADVPVNAPNSFANRGFYIVDTRDLQVPSSIQADAVAKNLALRAVVFERISLTTAPDPRHNSYNIVRWKEENWLELAWSMALIEGGAMNHVLRKAYT